MNSDQRYDVIVVGAGIAGLMAANFLERGGKKTLLIEHNHQAGGCMNGIRRKGYYFECGDQSFESLGVMIPLLEELGVFRPEEWERADYRLVSDRFDVETTSFDAIEEAMVRGYPNDEKGVRSYFKAVREMSGLMSRMWADGAVPLARSGLGYNLKAFAKQTLETALSPGSKNALRWMTQPCLEFSKEHFTDPQLLEVFGDLAYSGASALFGTMFWHIWVHDYWYPKDGLQAFCNSLVANFEKLGGIVKFNRTVDEILIENGRARGIRTHKGESILADRIVHCGDYRRLVTKMVPLRYWGREFHDRIAHAAMSEPLVSVYLGLNMSNSELGEYLKTHHTFYFPKGRKNVWNHESNLDLHKDSFLEITWTSKNNEKLAPKGKSSVVLQTLTNYRWNNFWGTGGDDSARPEAYEKAKQLAADQMIQTLEKIVPGVKDRVDYCDVGSPQSTIRYTLNAEGASCSWRWDPKLAPFRSPHLRTPIRGLYTAGHYAFWPGGVPAAALSGKIVADLILNRIFSEPVDRINQIAARIRERVRPGAA